MLLATIELTNTTADEFTSLLLKNKEMKKRIGKISFDEKSIVKKRKKEPMTDYYANGKQLSVKEFKSRIAAAEEDIKARRVYTSEQLKQEMETWKKQKGYK